MSIPFVMYVPEKWKEQHASEYEALRTNSVRSVMNLDIAPTRLEAPFDGLREGAFACTGRTIDRNRDSFVQIS